MAEKAIRIEPKRSGFTSSLRQKESDFGSVSQSKWTDGESFSAWGPHSVIDHCLGAACQIMGDAEGKNGWSNWCDPDLCKAGYTVLRIRIVEVNSILSLYSGTLG